MISLQNVPHGVSLLYNVYHSEEVKIVYSQSGIKFQDL